MISKANSLSIMSSFSIASTVLHSNVLRRRFVRNWPAIDLQSGFTGSQFPSYLLFALLSLLGCHDDPAYFQLWYHYHAISISNHDVAWRDRHFADLDGTIDKTSVVFRRSANTQAAREHGEPRVFYVVCVADASINHETGQPALKRRLRHDVSP